MKCMVRPLLGLVCLSLSGFVMTSVATAQAPATGAAKGAATGADRSTIADNLAAIEGRLIDLQVQIAALRSLSGPVASSTIGTLERDMRALADDYANQAGKPSNLRPGATSAIAPSASVALAAPQSPAGTAPSGSGAASGWFGSTTVTPSAAAPSALAPTVPGASADPAPLPFAPAPLPRLEGGAMLPDGRPPDGRSPASPTGGGTIAGWGQPAPSAGGSVAEPAYRAAYNHLLQQDYGAAQAGFEAFLQRHPQDDLSSNAQYWLGETFYVRGNYRAAAKAFLTGYQTFGSGNKAPDSLFKLGLSLAKLKQAAAACSSLREVARRYPSAPRPLLDRAAAEARRLGCAG